MADVKNLRAGNRFGARYGKRNRDKVAEIELGYKKPQKCPYCHYIRVSRVSVGIWHCEKCDAKFTSRAYTLNKGSSEESTDTGKGRKAKDENQSREAVESESKEGVE